MLETFKARLKAKSTAAGANLSTKRIDAIADKLHKKFPDLTEEKDHDEKLDDYYDEESLKDIAKGDDRIRTLENKSRTPKPDPKKPVKKEGEEETEEIPDDTPPWFKKYQEENDKKLNALISERTQGSIKSKAQLKLKDIPAKYWEKRSLPEKEEDIDAFVTEVTADYTEFKQEMVNQGLSVDTRPPVGGGTGGKDAKVSPELKAYVEKHKPAETAKT